MNDHIKILKPVLKFYLKNKLNIDRNISYINIYGNSLHFYAYYRCFMGSFVDEESYWISMEDYNRYLSEYRESQIGKIFDV
jgi:uncharacterized LabA/DUF88 family protein